MATNFTESELTCPNDVNPLVSGDIPIKADALHISQKVFTSIAINVYRDNVVAFVGTNDGVVQKVFFLLFSSILEFIFLLTFEEKKYLGENKAFLITLQQFNQIRLDGINKSYVFQETEIRRGTPILQDMEVDGSGEYLFVMTSDLVSTKTLKICFSFIIVKSETIKSFLCKQL